MPPLILHNVPDDELYTGEDGITRPYAVLFPGADGTLPPRLRKAPVETGSFGKSTRRSRSRTGTPAAKREDPTLAAADALFGAFIQDKRDAPIDTPQRKPSLGASISQPNLSQSGPLIQVDGNGTGPSSRYVHKEPTEVILRGFRENQQYSAIREYERIGGRICEDYPRDASLDQRKFKSDLRDPASYHAKRLTAEEKAKVNRFAGGEHWIKVTFESAEAAQIAIESSPQTIHGYLIYAELYRGVPPTNVLSVPASGISGQPFATIGASGGTGFSLGGQATRRGTNTLPRSHTTPSLGFRGQGTVSPTNSQNSTNTYDTNTLSHTSTTASSATIIGGFQPTTSFLPPPSQSYSHSQSQPQQEPLLDTSSSSDPNIYCTAIPTAKRIALLPADQALLPQKSFSQKFVAGIPIIGWFTGDIIGSSVPRTDSGEFDWQRASFYWRVMWWIDSWTGLMDIVGGDKEE